MIEAEVQRLKSDLIRLTVRMLNVAGRARTTADVNDSGLVRTVQATFGYNQLKDAVPYIQHYGFASNPPPGSDLATISLNGDRANTAIIASNHQNYIIKNLGNGGVAMYDMFGNSIVMSSTGIKITSAVAIEFDAPIIRNHATTALKLDAGGTGQTFEPALITSYTSGVTTNVVAPDPPEIP